jgi:hypothetical protein
LLVETATVVPPVGAGGVTTIAGPPVPDAVGVAVTLPYCELDGAGAAFT